MRSLFEESEIIKGKCEIGGGGKRMKIAGWGASNRFCIRIRIKWEGQTRRQASDLLFVLS